MESLPGLQIQFVNPGKYNFLTVLNSPHNLFIWIFYISILKKKLGPPRGKCNAKQLFKKNIFREFQLHNTMHPEPVNQKSMEKSKLL